MKNGRKWWMTAAAAVVVASVVGIGAVAATEPVPTPTVGTVFIERVAGKLGIDSATLSDAIKSSANDEIDERLAAGELTQEQADAAKERVANAPDDALIGRGFGHGLGGRAHAVHAFASGAPTEFLGLTAEQLRTELQADGATLATVAKAHGKSRDELKAFLTSELQTYLDEAVAEGRITQEEADAKSAEHTANLDAMIDGTMPPFGGRFRAGPGGPFSGGAPDEMTPESSQLDSSLG